jgi:hypothetical protein
VSLAARDAEVRIGGGVAGRVQAVLAHYRPLAGAAEIRLHGTPLYNSIYRFDDDMLVNTHVYGPPRRTARKAARHERGQAPPSPGGLLARPGRAQADQPQALGERDRP